MAHDALFADLGSGRVDAGVDETAVASGLMPYRDRAGRDIDTAWFLTGSALALARG